MRPSLLTAAHGIVARHRRLTLLNLEPLLASLENAPSIEASTQARQVIGLLASQPPMDADVRERLESWLQERGYGLPQIEEENTRTGLSFWKHMLHSTFSGADETQPEHVYDLPRLGTPEYKAGAANRARFIRDTMATNVTEADVAYERLAARAGVLGNEGTVVVADNSIGPTHDAMKEKRVGSEDVLQWEDPQTLHGVHGNHTFGLATAGRGEVRGHSLRVLLEPSSDPAKRAMESEARASDPEYAHRAQFGLSLGMGRGAGVANIVSLSLAHNYRETKEAARQMLEQHPNTLFILGAGNSSKQLGISRPEFQLDVSTLRAPNLIVVASAQWRGPDRPPKLSSFSNYGPKAVTHAAIGTDVLSVGRENDFIFQSGTSMATPRVSNLAAKVLNFDPGLSAPQIKELLTDTTRRYDSWTNLVEAGGVIDPPVAYALAALTGRVRRGDTPEAAAAKLELDGALQTRLLPLVSKYV